MTAPSPRDPSRSREATPSHGEPSVGGATDAEPAAGPGLVTLGSDAAPACENGACHR